MNKTSPIVIALLLSDTSAINHGFRPTPGAVPWHGSATRPTWDTPDHPVNYFIPNLGMDHGILTTMNSLKIAENRDKKQLKASFVQDSTPDLRTPNLGQDEDVKLALAAINETQKESGKTFPGVTFVKPPALFAQQTQPDSEISDLKSSINLAEKKFNHKLPSKEGELSEFTYANVAETEQMYAHFVPVKNQGGLWMVPKQDNSFVQTELSLQSDPICNSAGCTQYKHPEVKDKDDHPINYSVPNFGMDRHITDSMENTKVAEQIVGHNWTWKEKKKPKVVKYPSERGLDADMVTSLDNLSNVEAKQGAWDLVQLGSQDDPICGTGGCNQFTHGHAARRGYDINYPVPNFGMDQDIKDSLSNMPVAQKIVGENWSDFGSPESKAKWSNPAKKVDYNFAPELDGNIRDSEKNLSDSETKLNHKYKLSLVQLEDDPICGTGGCNQFTHGHAARRGYDINYPVPNFGMDQDIKDSLSNMPVAQKIVGEKFSDFGSPEFKAKWSNPAKKVDYNFAPELDGNIRDSQKNLVDSEKKLNHQYKLSLVQLESDPICSSSGCGQYKHPESKEAKYDMDYSVPSFGMDRDVMGSLENLKVAEGVVNHKWAGIDKAKYANPAKKVDYNFAPHLDGDIIVSKANLSATEKKLDHEYKLA